MIAVPIVGFACLGRAGVMLAALVLTVWTFIFAAKARNWPLVGAAIIVLGALILFNMSMAMGGASIYATRTQCDSQIRHLILALQNYHDKYNAFPPAYIADDNGKPLHSWRVLVLPFLEQRQLYEAYDFNEPWDGPNNRKLLEKRPNVFVCPQRSLSGIAEPGMTNYFAVVGEKTIWPYADSRGFADASDGASRTVMVIESANENIFWTEPRDLDLEQAVAACQPTDTNVATWHKTGFLVTKYYRPHAGFIDGSATTLSGDLSNEALRQLFIIGDGFPERDLNSRQRGFRPHDYYGVGLERVNYLAHIRLGVFLVVALVPLPWVFKERLNPTAEIYAVKTSEDGGNWDS